MTMLPGPWPEPVVQRCGCDRWNLWHASCPESPAGDDGLCVTCRASHCKLYIDFEGEASHRQD